MYIKVVAAIFAPVLLSLYSGEGLAQSVIDDSVAENEILIDADKRTRTPGVSPARRIDRQSPGSQLRAPQISPNDLYRSIDGSGNNTTYPSMGKAGTQLVRWVKSDYSDQISAMAGASRPNPRHISNVVSAQSESMPDPSNASDFMWQWGQFLDHDIDLTDGVNPPQQAPIAVPAGDAHFDPFGTGTVQISLNRSIYDPATGYNPQNARQQMNEITGWIDASNVYGSDPIRAAALRTNDGTGRLRTSAGNLLPFNDVGLPNAGGSSSDLFLAGDVRANEQAGLTAMHTLFMREHNWHADRIRSAQPWLSGEDIYQRARQMVGAEIQAITYREFLPALLGPNAINPYKRYKPRTDSSISNLFSSASYRYGHSALSPKLLRLNKKLKKIPEGHLRLRKAFFNPDSIINEGGIEPLLRGLSKQVCQAVDSFIIDDVRNFLFGRPGAGGFDLAALNIQRGRDHGLPSYNDAREGLGLKRKARFSQITGDKAVRKALKSVYSSVDDIDVWLGGLAEDRHKNALVGELVFTVLKRQFTWLRNGDRYWYESTLSEADIRRVHNATLAKIIRRNTKIGREIADDVFHVY